MTQALSQTPSEFLPFLRQQGATHILLLAVMPFSDGMPASQVGARSDAQGQLRAPSRRSVVSTSLLSLSCAGRG